MTSRSKMHECNSSRQSRFWGKEAIEFSALLGCKFLVVFTFFFLCYALCFEEATVSG